VPGRHFIVWIVAGLLVPLAAGCGSWEEPAISPAPPAASASAQPPAPTDTLVVAPTLSPTSIPALAPTPAFTPEPIAPEGMDVVTFTIVYDNNAYNPALRTDWGFACLVETPGTTVLFDTGADGRTLLGNMAALGLDLEAIDAIVLSHIHGDHTGGLTALLDTGIRPTVYVPATFPVSFKDGVRARTSLVEVQGPVEICPGIHTTGEMGSSMVEQALVVATGDGLVVVTGCAHPGIVEMVRRAREVVEGDVALVVGGFHLGQASRSRIDDIIAEFRRLGVWRTAPCHCTGDQARRMFADAFGTDFILTGVGGVITAGSGEGASTEPTAEGIE
jgi:7,8-dihydropterin-6-yl-methyl-4-(beta-D-ribofuranosyl)aminobenzene 5'-phosphate synthase